MQLINDFAINSNGTTVGKKLKYNHLVVSCSSSSLLLFLVIMHSCQCPLLSCETLHIYMYKAICLVWLTQL